MNKKIILAIFLPVFALGLLTIKKVIHYNTGSEIVLDIEGYDPRDLLSGHYLIYRIKYNAENICKGKYSDSSSSSSNQDAYMCLVEDKHYFTFGYTPTRCELKYIKGKCKGTRFVAGVEKFYIPQEHASRLEKLVIEKKASVRLSINRSGKALVKDLLIDGKPWKEFL
jgi:uncharacterized membrane-anchored protein